MGLVIDLIIIIFILASIFLGYKKGLISLAVHLVAFIIAVVVVLILYKPVANVIINNTNIDENLSQTIQEMVEKNIASGEADEVTNTLIESAKQGMLPQASNTLAVNVIYGSTMLVLFIIVRVALIFVTALANLVAKLPILKQFNELGGAVYGLLRGLVIVYVVLMLINLSISIMPASTLSTAVDESILAKTMINYNIINVFLK